MALVTEAQQMAAIAAVEGQLSDMLTAAPDPRVRGPRPSFHVYVGPGYEPWVDQDNNSIMMNVDVSLPLARDISDDSMRLLAMNHSRTVINWLRENVRDVGGLQVWKGEPLSSDIEEMTGETNGVTLRINFHLCVDVPRVS